jgi:hypothetical protein
VVEQTPEDEEMEVDRNCSIEAKKSISEVDTTPSTVADVNDKFEITMRDIYTDTLV